MKKETETEIAETIKRTSEILEAARNRRIAKAKKQGNPGNLRNLDIAGFVEYLYPDDEEDQDIDRYDGFPY